MGLFENLPYSNQHNMNLDWIIAKMKEIKDYIDSLPADLKERVERIPGIEAELLVIDERLANLEQFEDDFKNGRLIDLEVEALGDWVDANLISMVEKIVKYVFFVLEDGYFVAYIPDSWDELTFNSQSDPEQADYGSLILTW